MKASWLRVVVAGLAWAVPVVAQDAERAERLFRQGDYAAAQQAYAQAAEAGGPHRGALLLGSGVAALRAGALSDAVLWLDRAAQRLADPKPALRGVAFAQQSLGLPAGSEPSVEPVGCDGTAWVGWWRARAARRSRLLWWRCSVSASVFAARWRSSRSGRWSQWRFATRF